MRIAIDIDEVLGGLLPSFLAFYEERSGRSFTLAEFDSYEWWHRMGITQDALNELFDEFASSSHFENMRPVDGAIPAIERLREDHTLIVITSRPPDLAEQTERWLCAHFPDAFAKIYMTNQYRREGFWQSKAEVCKEENVDLIVEDNAEYALECVKEGIPALLFEMPWNAGLDLPKNIVRVASWDEILVEVNRRAA